MGWDSFSSWVPRVGGVVGQELGKGATQAKSENNEGNNLLYF